MLGISNDQLVLTAEANEIFVSETAAAAAGCDNEHVDTSSSNHVNDCQDTSGLILCFKDILHVAVDSERHLIQIASAPAVSTPDEDCSVGVGGTIVFRNDRELFKFQQSLQACLDINMFYINARQNSRLL